MSFIDYLFSLFPEPSHKHSWFMTGQQKEVTPKPEFRTDGTCYVYTLSDTFLEAKCKWCGETRWFKHESQGW